MIVANAAPPVPNPATGAPPKEALVEQPATSTSSKEAALPEQGSAIPDGAGPAVAPPEPKPVEIASVPETPVNETPAGASPRPVLNIAAEIEKHEISSQEALAGATDSSGPPPSGLSVKENSTIPEPIIDHQMQTVDDTEDSAKMTGALLVSEGTDDIAATSAVAGEKRKLDESVADTSTSANGTTVTETEHNTSEVNINVDGQEPVGKKAKLDEDSASQESANGTDGPKKVGRPRKEKTDAPVVGRTARQTRSQGPVQGGL